MNKKYDSDGRSISVYVTNKNYAKLRKISTKTGKTISSIINDLIQADSANLNSNILDLEVVN